MKIILSPTKALDENVNYPDDLNYSQPLFLEDASKLVKKLSKKSPKQIKALMNVSDAIANLNAERFDNWDTPITGGAAKPAAFLFNGEAFKGLDAHSMNNDQLELLNEKLFILSGLYGILKPLDLMLPYRLEMGTSYAYTPKQSNLYKFWGDKLKNHIENEMDSSEVLVNVASNEYNKVLQLKKMNQPVITCHFKEKKDNQYKAIMVYAKKARGLMTRFIVMNNLNNAEDLKAFNYEGYQFLPSLSSETEYTFVR